MKFKIKILAALLTSVSFLYGFKPEINIGSISFYDADWDVKDNLILSRQNISGITSSEKAVLLHFFTAQTC